MPVDGRTRVLIAGSDRALGDLYRGALQAGAWEVEVVHDGRSTLDRIRASPPDLLLVDALPDYDSITLIKTVRDNPRTRDLAVVVLYDTVDRRDPAQAKGLGVLAWLIKNRVTRSKLLETLTALLENPPTVGRLDET